MYLYLFPQRYTKNSKKHAFLPLFQLSVVFILFLTFGISLIFNGLQKCYKNTLKKIEKKVSSY